MRRPSPLPQPPAAPREGVAPTVPARGTGRGRATTMRDEADAAPPGTTEVAADDNPPAPVIPMTAPLPRRDDGAGRSRDDDVDGVAGDARFAGVWKAARARRKALRAEVRRFTVRQRRRRALWIGVAASFVVLALATIGAAYSPLFAVQRISVVGAQQLNADEVAAALSAQIGTPLPLVDESAVKAELIAFPLVQSYTLEARPPHDLVVRIVERTPVGVMETRAGYTLVDAAGVALSTSETPPAGAPLLVIQGGVDSDAFAAAGQVMRSLPADIRGQVTEVSASTPDDVTLTLGGTDTQIVWGSAEDSAEKANNLAKLMVSRPPTDVAVYDVSSPSAIVVR